MTGTAKVLVAGIGNVFLGDDGFGVEVAHRLAEAELPPFVDVADYGIRGVHLAYELLDADYDTLVLVDALPLGEPAGTVAVVDATDPKRCPGQALLDAHSMSPAAVLDNVRHLGGELGRVYVVGCQPAVLDEGVGLSPAVAAAVEPAARLTVDLVEREAGVPAGAAATSTVSRRTEGARQWTPSNC